MHKIHPIHNFKPTQTEGQRETEKRHKDMVAHYRGSRHVLKRGEWCSKKILKKFNGRYD